ncbi:uncharacterized protein [Apteryx mantelli]|uniref:Uncharacterized protein isoform X3 n=1 Tax=Apteryx mantelli TaxID=2696672 RepID=A0A8B7ILZ5_9AVES|nr:PREDICTED: uncharacterized protein LOC106485980 isoform X3 [Apteryx mantelli mantelli]
MFGSDSFIFSGSSDKNARLWTADGKFVGNFGQEKRWDLKNPSAFIHAGEPWGDQKEAKKERSVTRQQAVADGLLLKPGELQIPEGKQVHGASTNASKMEQEEYQQETQLLKADPPTKSASPSQLYSEGTVQSHLTPSQLLDSTSDQRNHKEMQKLTLPQDSPMTSQIPNKETVCTTESDVRSLQLTFPRLDREQAETSSLKEKQQPAGQTKTPWLPPLVNPTKASLSSSRQAKRCQLPSLLPEQPFLPWKSRY